MIKPDESAVAVFRVEIRPIPRQNVGMEVDLHVWNLGRFCELRKHSEPRQMHYSDSIGGAFSTFLPHFSQVRRASSFQKSTIA